MRNKKEKVNITIVMSNPQGERRGEARASDYNTYYRQRRF